MRVAEGGLAPVATFAKSAAARQAILYEMRYSLIYEGPFHLNALREYALLNEGVRDAGGDADADLGSGPRERSAADGDSDSVGRSGGSERERYSDAVGREAESRNYRKPKRPKPKRRKPKRLKAKWTKNEKGENGVVGCSRLSRLASSAFCRVRRSAVSAFGRFRVSVVFGFRLFSAFAVVLPPSHY